MRRRSAATTARASTCKLDGFSVSARGRSARRARCGGRRTARTRLPLRSTISGACSGRCSAYWSSSSEYARPRARAPATQRKPAASNPTEGSAAMDQAFDRVLGIYRKRIADESAASAALSREEFATRRDDFLLAVGEPAARFLHSLAIGLGAKTIVEL